MTYFYMDYGGYDMLMNYCYQTVREDLTIKYFKCFSSQRISLQWKLFYENKLIKSSLIM